MTYIRTPSDDAPFEIPDALVQQLAEEHADSDTAALSESRPQPATDDQSTTPAPEKDEEDNDRQSR